MLVEGEGGGKEWVKSKKYYGELQSLLSKLKFNTFCSTCHWILLRLFGLHEIETFRRSVLVRMLWDYKQSERFLWIRFPFVRFKALYFLLILRKLISFLHRSNNTTHHNWVIIQLPTSRVFCSDRLSVSDLRLSLAIFKLRRWKNRNCLNIKPQTKKSQTVRPEASMHQSQ